MAEMTDGHICNKRPPLSSVTMSNTLPALKELSGAVAQFGWYRGKSRPITELEYCTFFSLLINKLWDNFVPLGGKNYEMDGT